MRSNLRKTFSTLLITCIWGMLLDRGLWAHVAIFPRTFQAGALHDAFYVRAPVEKDIPVVELGIEVEDAWRSNGGDVADFQEIPGWSQHVELDDKGKIKKAYWQVLAGNKGTVPTTFQMIWARVSMPKQPGAYHFPAWQKYADGSVVWWNELRGEGKNPENPAPEVTITAKEASSAGVVSGSWSMTTLTGPLALAIALLALVMALRNQRKRES